MKESFNTNAFEVDMYAAEPDSLVPDVRILFIRIDQSRNCDSDYCSLKFQERIHSCSKRILFLKII